MKTEMSKESKNFISYNVNIPFIVMADSCKKSWNSIGKKAGHCPNLQQSFGMMASSGVVLQKN